MTGCLYPISICPSWQEWRWVALSLLLIVGAGNARAGTQPTPSIATWKVTAGEVQVRCRLTVGGSFDATTSDISGLIVKPPGGETPPTGGIMVELSTLDTGINLRNEHLRTRYLTVGRGPRFGQALLTALQLEAPMRQDTPAHRTSFTGTLLLHGVEQTVSGESQIRQTNGYLRVQASFAVSLNDFGIEPPRYLGVGVRDEVAITITLVAAREKN